MTSLKCAAAFAATLGTLPVTALAQETNITTAFNPEATARIMFFGEGMIHPIGVRETFANMQLCIENMEAEATDFIEMRDTDIIGPNDRFIYICEDEQRIERADFTRFGGVQRSTYFKP